MSCKPEDFLVVAENLLAEEAPRSEAMFRSAASRAYYAALHAADMALPVDLEPSSAERKGKGSHQAVIDAMTKWGKAIRPGRSEAIAVARNLPRLKTVRKLADYGLADSFTLEEARHSIRVSAATIASATRAASQAAPKTA